MLITYCSHAPTQLTDLKRELEGVCVQCVTMAPTDMYRKMEEKVCVFGSSDSKHTCCHEVGLFRCTLETLY